MTLHDAVCSEPELECQEAAGRGAASAERVCREQYLRTREPDDGLALARVLLGRDELRGAAAIAQGLLPTPVRPDALYLLARVALLEGRHDEAERSLELAAEQHLRVERWREGTSELIELGVLLARRGQGAAARATLERAFEVAKQHGDTALLERVTLGLSSMRLPAPPSVPPLAPPSASPAAAPALPSPSGNGGLPLGWSAPLEAADPRR